MYYIFVNILHIHVFAITLNNIKKENYGKKK